MYTPLREYSALHTYKKDSLTDRRSLLPTEDSAFFCTFLFLSRSSRCTQVEPQLALHSFACAAFTLPALRTDPPFNEQLI